MNTTRFPIGILSKLDYLGTLFLNIPEYSTFEVGRDNVSTMEFVDVNGNDLDDPIETDLTNMMMPADWFLNLIFEGIEDYEPYE